MCVGDVCVAKGLQARHVEGAGAVIGVPKKADIINVTLEWAGLDASTGIVADEKRSSAGDRRPAIQASVGFVAAHRPEFRAIIKRHVIRVLRTVIGDGVKYPSIDRQSVGGITKWKFCPMHTQMTYKVAADTISRKYSRPIRVIAERRLIPALERKGGQCAELIGGNNSYAADRPLPHAG